MPIMITGDSGDISCCVRAAQGEPPVVRVRIAIGDQTMAIELNPHQGELFATAMLADAKHGLGFAPPKG